MISNQFNKTRIAPTPSGYLHLGNAYSFLLTQTIALQTGAKILLRIDDLDEERTRALYIQDIFDTLDFLEIKYDEGPRDYGEFKNEYSQLHRGPLYETALQQLADRALVYACNCSRAQLEMEDCRCSTKNINLNTPDTAWRLKTDDAKELSVNSFDKGILKETLPPEMKDFIVRKKDGRPSYQLASLMDDQHYGIDLVIRGKDLWPSTLAQLFLAEKLNISSFINTTFHHHHLLNDEKAAKLSKSAGALSIQALRKDGKTLNDIRIMAGKAKF